MYDITVKPTEEKRVVMQKSPKYVQGSYKEVSVLAINDNVRFGGFSSAFGDKAHCEVPISFLRKIIKEYDNCK